MVDIIDIIVGKLLSLLKGIYRLLRLSIYMKYSHIKKKRKEKKKIEARYSHFRTKVLNEKAFNKLKKKKKIKIIGSELYPVIYKPKHFDKKRNNNNTSKD